MHLVRRSQSAATVLSGLLTRAEVRILPTITSRLEPLNRGGDALPRVQADQQVGPTESRFMESGEAKA